MFALRSRPWALPVRQSALRWAVPSAISVCETPLHAQTLPYPATRSSSPSALFPRAFAQERKLTPLFSKKRTSSNPQSRRQPTYLQSFPHPLTLTKILTPTLPSSCRLFVRSLASVRISTPLVSCACTLFCKNTRVGVYPSKPNPRPANGFRGCYSGSAKKSEGLSNQP